MRHDRVGVWIGLAVCVLKPPLTLWTRREWRGQDNVPLEGGLILAVNHISYLDPFAVAHFVYDTGRLPRFLAKESLFRLPLAGRIVRGAGQIPVHRYSENAAQSLSAAADALRRGECVVIYPEGTVTKDPTGWPMRAHTGVARLALDTGVPVVPVGQWGAQRILGLGERRPHLGRRHVVRFLVGPQIDLSGYTDREQSARVLREVTDLVMASVRDLVAELRGKPAPVAVFDPRIVTPVHETRRSA